MAVLIIGPDQKAALRAAMERARARPISRAVLEAHALPRGHHGPVTLADRDRHPELIRPQSEHVALPGGFRAAFSYEEQDPGICLHLSVSTDRPGRVPHPMAIALILDALDLPKPVHLAHEPWTEEFTVDGEPGGYAYNLLIMTAPTLAGHA